MIMEKLSIKYGQEQFILLEEEVILKRGFYITKKSNQ